jgi:hypothetical protein
MLWLTLIRNWTLFTPILLSSIFYVWYYQTL